MLLSWVEKPPVETVVMAWETASKALSPSSSSTAATTAVKPAYISQMIRSVRASPGTGRRAKTLWLSALKSRWADPPV